MHLYLGWKETNKPQQKPKPSSFFSFEQIMNVDIYYQSYSYLLGIGRASEAFSEKFIIQVQTDLFTFKLALDSLQTIS